jgi:radical SAM superfamily enzyme YgiQ (UPF0313 family)
MKIIFVNSPEVEYGQSYGTLFSPLWAFTLAAYLPEGWEYEIADCVLGDWQSIGTADVFAFSGINQDFLAIKKNHDHLKAKYPDARFLLGGPITWSMEQEDKLGLLAFFDHIFILDGEVTLAEFLAKFAKAPSDCRDKIIKAGRFDLTQARSIDFNHYREVADNYYGCVIEVSRGCPFLCEFCDIRVLPGNNRANNKSIDIIIAEMDSYYKLGITQIQFVCDNFIGDVAWARDCVDAIIAWKKKTKAQPSIFTWLTINLCNYPDLMAKMRDAGFSILYIGIESVNQNSLLETAKVQNTQNLRSAVEDIQSYGFIIAPGLIFGFDSDTDTVFEDTLDFIKETGIIGGDPSFMMALPGTPLLHRMKQTGRLIEVEDQGISRAKISTNIRYLQSVDFLSNGFINFIEEFSSAEFQYQRFKSHVERIVTSGNYQPIDGAGYGSLWEYFKLQLTDATNRKMLIEKLSFLILRPANLNVVLKAWWLTKKVGWQGFDVEMSYKFWGYFWTNIALKYQGLKASDLKLYSVDEDFDFNRLMEGTAAEEEIGNTVLSRQRGDVKSTQQARVTNQALKKLVEKKQANKSKTYGS